MRNDIMIIETPDGFAAAEIAGSEAKTQLEKLKDEIESVRRKIEIIVKLPRTFRDAVTLETKFSGTVVFSVPAEIAKNFGLLTAE